MQAKAKELLSSQQAIDLIAAWYHVMLALSGHRDIRNMAGVVCAAWNTRLHCIKVICPSQVADNACIRNLDSACLHSIGLFHVTELLTMRCNAPWFLDCLHSDKVALLLIAEISGILCRIAG